jgi:hypothetical protein
MFKAEVDDLCVGSTQSFYTNFLREINFFYGHAVLVKLIVITYLGRKSMVCFYYFLLNISYDYGTMTS